MDVFEDQLKEFEAKVCVRCHQEKSIDEFYTDFRRGKLQGACKTCQKVSTARCRVKRLSNPEKRKEVNDKGVAKYYKTKQQKLCVYCRKEQAEEGKVRCIECNERTNKRLCQPEERKKIQERYHKQKDEIFEKLGGKFCACCDEAEPKFLSLDHKNNDGSNHRKKLANNRPSWRVQNYLVIRELIAGRANYEDFQVLCMNCNFGKARNDGICPHKEKTL